MTRRNPELILARPLSNEIALILIGYQADLFSPTGCLHNLLEDSARVAKVLANTLELLQPLVETPITIVSTPIVFTENYEELANPTGILGTIKRLSAFRQGTPGAETVAELQAFGDRVLEVPGKRGLNAFTNTKLQAILQERGIREVWLAGAVTSVCIDSTARSAYEQGYRVAVLSDCTAGRSETEQTFYCEEIFPLYARVLTREDALSELGRPV